MRVIARSEILRPARDGVSSKSSKNREKQFVDRVSYQTIGGRASSRIFERITGPIKGCVGEGFSSANSENRRHTMLIDFISLVQFIAGGNHYRIQILDASAVVSHNSGNKLTDLPEAPSKAVC